MSLDNDIIVATAETPAAQERGSYIEWSAIIGGIVLASAISILFLAFGSAVGLSFANFGAGPDVNPIWIAIAAASWLLWVQISSFMAGGYLAGRMRRRLYDATEHESDIRDGAHGLLVWAGALVVGAVIAAGGVGAAISTAGNAIGTLTNAAAAAADDGAGPEAYFVDTLFRPVPGSAAPAATLQDYRGEATRILAQSVVTGSLADTDKAYLGQMVAANTGLSQEEATTRVDQVMAAVDEARAKAAAAAEEARRWTVLGAFLTAASLLVSAVGAYWAAMKGGNHRDKQVVFADLGRF